MQNDYVCYKDKGLFIFVIVRFVLDRSDIGIIDGLFNGSNILYLYVVLLYDIVHTYLVLFT